MFDDEFDFEEEIFPEKKALDSLEALNLISKLYKSKKDKQELKEVLYILKDELPKLMAYIPKQDQNLRRMYDKLYTLSAKIVEEVRLPILKSKTVIGVGGMFSSGKSTFLNSLTGIELLPSDQQKSTAIATYIALGEQEKIIAYTSKNYAVTLNKDEIEAISHQFYSDYGIGFSNIIQKIVMTIPNFKWSNIVLLDTPGYNSEISNDSVSSFQEHDAKIARDHLSNCDYLLWITSVDNGVIPPSDIAFIKSLHIVNPPLIILNKADKKTESDLREIINECKKNLEDAFLPYYAITAYDSHDGKENLSQRFLIDYMDNASQNSKNKVDDVGTELTWLRKEWSDEMKKKNINFEKQINEIQKGIVESQNPRSISSLLHSYQIILQNKNTTYHQANHLEKLFKILLEKLYKLSWGGVTNEK